MAKVTGIGGIFFKSKEPERLRQWYAEAIGEVEEYPYGRFAWILDLEGNKVELWEPRGEEGQAATGGPGAEA